MGWKELVFDSVDTMAEVMPRRWRRRLGGVMLLAFFVFPTQARDAFSWWTMQRSEQLTRLVLEQLDRTPAGPLLELDRLDRDGTYQRL